MQTHLTILQGKVNLLQVLFFFLNNEIIEHLNMPGIYIQFWMRHTSITLLYFHFSATAEFKKQTLHTKHGLADSLHFMRVENCASVNETDTEVWR